MERPHDSNPVMAFYLLRVLTAGQLLTYPTWLTARTVRRQEAYGVDGMATAEQRRADERAREAGNEIDQLTALIAAGGFWRLAPSWVPRTGYPTPTPRIMQAVEVGLRGLL